MAKRIRELGIETSQGTFETVTELAEFCGVKRETIWSRLRTGWSIEQAAGFEARPKKREKKGKEVVFQGRAYPSLMALTRHLQLNYRRVVQRLDAGWSIKQALEVEERKHQNSHHRELVTSQGKFSSTAEAGRQFGLDPKVITARLARGWSDDEAVGLKARPPRKGHRSKRIVCNAIEYPSIRALAKSFDVNEVRTRKRINSGWTPEQAVGIEAAPPRFRDENGAARDHAWIAPTVVKGGQTVAGSKTGQFLLYRIEELSSGRNYIGLTTSDLKTRLRGHWGMVRRGRQSKLYNRMRKALEEGRKDDFIIILLRDDARSVSELQHQEIQAIQKFNTIENGFNTAMGGSIGTSKVIEVEGKKFVSHNAAANHYGVDPDVFNLRLNRLNYTPEEAAGIVDRHWVSKPKAVELEGRTFPSIQTAAQHYGLNYGVVRARLNRSGWSLEQAFELEAPPSTVRTSGVEVTVQGQKFASITEASQRFDVKPDSVTNRMRSKGETCEEAILHLVRRKS